MKVMQRWIVISLAFTTIVGLSGCEMLFGSDDDDGSGAAPIPVVYDDQIIPIDFSSGGATKEIEMTGLSGRSLYLVKANYSASAAVNEETGVVSYTADGGVVAPSALERESVSMKSDLSQYGITPEELYSGDLRLVTEDGRYILDRRDVREFSAELSHDARAAARSNSRSSVAPERTAEFSVGETTTFAVDDGPNGSDSFEDIPVTLRAKGDHSYIWIHNPNYNNSSSSQTDNELTTAQAQEMSAAFDLIYDEVTNLYGYEIGGGGGGDGGLDGDSRINILFYDIGDDYSADQSGGILGYFWGKDAYTQTQVNEYGWGLDSNEAEIFYIDVHFTDSWSSKIKGTLAHEFQHMIHFNQKRINQGLLSPAWFNEMLSMVAEDMVSETLATTVYQSHPSARIGRYNDGYVLSGVVDWLSDGDVLYSYASAYLFGAFLVRNYGGADLVRELSTNGAVGISSINNALAALSYSERFEDIVEAYARLHVFPTGHPVLAHDFSGGDVSYGGETYRLPSFDLFDVQNFDGTDGPFVLDIDSHTLDTVRPYGFQTWSAASWQNLSTDNFTVELERPTNSDVQLYLMIK